MHQRLSSRLWPSIDDDDTLPPSAPDFREMSAQLQIRQSDDYLISMFTGESIEPRVGARVRQESGVVLHYESPAPGCLLQVRQRPLLDGRHERSIRNTAVSLGSDVLGNCFSRYDLNSATTWSSWSFCTVSSVGLKSAIRTGLTTIFFRHLLSLDATSADS